MASDIYTGDFRLIFDTIPEAFDRYRVHYSPELFADFVQQGDIQPGSSVLELGPGTGQATEPVLDTGCQYHGIELGENFSRVLQRKYGSRTNFTLLHDDFITHDFGSQKFDAVYSAATIQWMPESIAFEKCLSLLKPGGLLGMMMLRGGYRDSNVPLYDRIQQVYSEHFHPTRTYDSRKFRYENAAKYGFVDCRKREYRRERVLTAEEYIGYCSTHSDHIALPEPHRSRFFQGLRQAVMDFGNKIVFQDIYVLLTVRRPARCLRIATEQDISVLAAISKRAFDTDVEAGASAPGGPPGYDSLEWHGRMQKDRRLYAFCDGETAVGGAVLFETGEELYVGRVFLSPARFRQGLGKELMGAIEARNVEGLPIRLDTPLWNRRTRSFYTGCGYRERGRDAESLYFEKIVGAN